MVGYLHVDQTEVIYLQWPSDNYFGAIENATAKDDSAQGDPPDEKVSDQTNSIQGQINSNGGVALQFEGMAGTVYGRKSGNTLTLNLPRSDGGFTTTLFHVASSVDYNGAVATLQNSVQQANQNYIQQQSQQRQQQQEQQQQEQQQRQDALRQAQANKQTNCGEVHGLWRTTTPPYCEVTYGGIPYTVIFDSAGNITPGYGAPRNATECANYGIMGGNTWHPDTMICDGTG